MEGERYCLTSDAIADLGRYSYSFGFGLIVRSAHSRGCRAISMGSAVVTSLAGFKEHLMLSESDFSFDHPTS